MRIPHNNTPASQVLHKSLLSLVFINSVLGKGLVPYYGMLNALTASSLTFSNRTLLFRPVSSYIKFLLTPPHKKSVEHPLHYLPKNFNFSKQFFKHYVRLGLYIPSEAYNVHFSYSTYYMYNSGKNLGFLNIKAFFRV